MSRRTNDDDNLIDLSRGAVVTDSNGLAGGLDDNGRSSSDVNLVTTTDNESTVDILHLFC